VGLCKVVTPVYKHSDKELTQRCDFDSDSPARSPSIRKILLYFYLFFIFKPASFQEKGFIVSCESVCPDVCYRRSEDTGRKVTFST